MSLAKKLKKKLLAKKKKERFKEKDYLSSGSTRINLACTGHPRCAFKKGGYYLIVGDSASGKTVLTLTCLAEASINPAFDNYRLIHDDIEGGNQFNIKKLFPKLSKRLEPPAKDEEGEPVYSSTTEEMYYHIDDALEKGKPFVYIVDSMDGLDTTEDEEKFKKLKEAHRKGKKTTGSYGTSKAKANSTNLRRLMPKLRKSGSILIIISQTRDNLGFGHETKTRAGGRALRFYASMELWLSLKEKLRKTYKGKPRVQGVLSKAQIKKNRATGQDHTVEVPIYYSAGIDDIGSCIDYMVDEGPWKSVGKSIKAGVFGKLSRDKLIKHIQDNGLETTLQDAVGQVFNEIQEAVAVKRKNRYS